MAVFVPVREDDSTPWGRLILSTGRSKLKAFNPLAQVRFAEDEDKAQGHCFRLRDRLIESFPSGSSRRDKLEQACPSVMYVANHAGAGEFVLGTAAQRSWEMGYLLSCLEESGDFSPEADVDVWATGMFDFERGRFSVREKELAEKYDHICRTPARSVVLLAPVDPVRTPDPKISFRRIVNLADLARYVQEQTHKQVLRDTDPARLELKDICKHSPGRDDAFVDRHLKIHRPLTLAAPSRIAAGRDAPPEPESLAAVMEIYRRFVILGGPWSGKSTALRRCQYLLAKQALDSADAPFPVLLDAAEADDGSSFDDLLRRARRRPEIPEGRPLVYLVDNLDRLDARRLEQVGGVVDDPSYPQMILAGDLGAERLELPIPGVELMPLADDQIVRFVTLALGAENGSAILARISAIDDFDGRSSGVREVLRNPRLLSLVCRNAESFADLEVTHDVGLPADFLRMLAQRILLRAGISKLRARPSLSEMAGFLGPRALVGLGINALPPEAVNPDAEILRALAALAESCGFVDENGQFSHDSWRDVFAGAYLADRPDLLAQIVAAPRCVNGELRTPVLQPVVVHIVRLAAEPGRILRSIAVHDPFLAAQAMAWLPEGFAASGDDRSAIVDGLSTYLASNDSTLRDLAGDTLVGFGADAVAPLRAVIEDTDIEPWLRARAVDLLGQFDCVEAFIALAFALDFPGRPSKSARRIMRALRPEERPLLEQVIRDHLGPFRPFETGRRIGTLMVECWRGVEDGLIRAVGAALGLNVIPYLGAGPARATPTPIVSIVVEQPASRARMGFGDTMLDAAVPATERDASARNTSFGRAWCAAWAARPGDPALVRRASAWLRAESYGYGSWTYVWLPLFQHLPANPELQRHGREWLRINDLNHRTWTYVWSALFSQLPRDPELRELGRAWLDDAPIEHPSWGYVWKPLFDADPDADLRGRGIAYLREQSMADPTFTYVWRSLWDVAPDDAELLEYARLWFAQANIGDPAWGFVWPPLWRYLNKQGYRIDDAADWRRYLHGVGSRLLADGRRNSGAWAFVFQAMWDHGRSEDLVAMGMEWLRSMSADNGGFAYIWDRLQKARPNDAELTDIGLTAIEALSPGRGAWPTLWNGLMRRKCGERLLQCAGREQRLGDLGLEVLDALPPYRSAWSTIWSNVNLFRKDDATVFEKGRAWLEGAPIEEPGMGYVLEPMVQQAPDDEWLRQYASNWLRRADARHPSWGRVWLALQPPGGSAVLAEGFRWLGRGTWKHNEWSHVWEFVSYRMRAEGEERALIDLAVQWLDRVHVREKGRMRVLNRLAELRRDLPAVRKWVAPSLLASLRASCEPSDVMFPKTPTEWNGLWSELEEDAHLRQELESALTGWIHKTAAFDTAAFPFAWNHLFKLGSRNDGFMALGRRWLQDKPVTARGWALVWLCVVSVDGLDDAWVVRAWPWMSRDNWTRSSWPLVWLRLREGLPDRVTELDELAAEFFAKIEPAQYGVAKHLPDFCAAWVVLAEAHGRVKAGATWGWRAIELLPHDHPMTAAIRKALNAQ